MKRAISLALSLIMVLSIFISAPFVKIQAEAGEISDIFTVKTSGFEDGKITYKVYLNAGLNVSGAVVQAKFDTTVLQVVSGGAAVTIDKYGDECYIVPGMYVSGFTVDTDNTYSVGFLANDLSKGYNVGNSTKPFMQFVFEPIGEATPESAVEFYCVEYTSITAPDNNIEHGTNVLITALSTIHEHSYGDWEQVTAATETKNGVKAKICATCDKEITEIIPATGNNYTDVFHKEVFGLWWKLGFMGDAQIYDFAPDVIKFYTLRHIDLYEYYAGEKEIETGNGTISITYSAIPADVFEGQALKHFYIDDINVLRNDDSDPVYNPETNTYDMPDVGGWGDSITYATKGYKNIGNGTYEVYGYTVERAYEKPEDAVEGVDYIIHEDWPSEIVRCLKVTIEYNTTDVKFVSWETVSLSDVPHITELVHNHILTDWITDKTATVNAAGSKHKECTVCGETLEMAEIAQLKCATPILTKVINTASGVQFTWGKVSGADKYVVYRKAYDAKTKKWSGWSKLNDKVTGTSYLDKTAKSGTYYLYTVRANNEAGLSGYNKTGLKIYFLSIPKITSTANTNSGITVKWSKVSGATGYIVYKKTGNGKWTNLGKIKGTTFTDKKAKAGVTYKYTVKAYYGSYASAYNTSGVAVRRLLTPTLKSVTSAKTGVTLKWGKATGATGYIVYRKTGNGSWQKIATVKGASKVSYLDKTAKKGVTYTYTVKAYYGTSRSAHNTKGLTIKDKY